MLVIRRHAGQAIVVGEDVEIEIVKCASNRVVLGIRAPRDIVVGRREAQSTRQQNLAAAQAVPAVTAEGIRQCLLGESTLPRTTLQVSAGRSDKHT
jgi:carbon storage regulator